MFFESLESRSLFSVSLAAGTLTVTGTNLADTITFTKNKAGQLAVSDDGALHTYAWGSVSKIVVNVLGGDDSVRADNTVSKPMLVHGGDGGDVLFGGSGNDSLFGDAGDDRIDGQQGNDDMHGGSGEDTVDYSARTNNLSISLDDLANDGVAGAKDNAHSDFEVVLGGSGNDSISAAPTTVAIIGNGGNDSLDGGSSNASLFGGDGNDFIVGGSGPGLSWIYGGNGDDHMYVNGGQNYVSGDAGNDYAYSYGTGFTWEYGGDGNDTLYGGAHGNITDGGAGDDYIDDYLSFDRNHIYGESGNDSLFGGFGDNVIYAGDGNDLVRARGMVFNYVTGDGGDDRLYAGGGGTSSLFGGDGNDSLWGGAGVDYLSGDAGDDTLVSVGGGQTDTEHGGDGFDNFWLDRESSEQIDDVDIVEALDGGVHRIGFFANGPDRELNRPNIPDPTDAGATKNFAQNPLFSSVGPDERDIHQGGVNDCYFLCTLAGAARIDPEKIRQSVVDLGDGTYAVQFYRPNTITPTFMRVDADLPVDSFGNLKSAHTGLQGAIWVPIMEKAFAYFRTRANTYDSIGFGWMKEVMQDLNGSSISEKYSWSSGTDLLNYIAGQLNAGKVVTIATPATESSGVPLVGQHAYTVEQVIYRTITSGGKTTTVVDSVVLRNPWGIDGVSDGSDPNDGYVTVTADQAFRGFIGVNSAFL